jgi:hypothetical protein
MLENYRVASQLGASRVVHSSIELLSYIIAVFIQFCIQLYFGFQGCSVCLNVLAYTSVSIFGTNMEEGCALIHGSCK